MLWTQNVLSNKNIQKLNDNNTQCMKEETSKHENLKASEQRTLDRAVNKLPKIKQLFYT